ncbi:MAG: response regulator [Desulfomonilaceae bacterium]|nr:response regulator [Desulfomonilaceae bacterium]
MKKILVVDDMSELRELVAKTLARDDCRVLEAESGEQALRLARDEKPDLIMMDIMMPGTIDGLEATRILRNDPLTKGCKIIMLTAKGQAADITKGIDAGADDYFVKPFSPLELMRKVDEILG